jgi:hypothetical protein
LRAAGIDVMAETFSGPDEIANDILRRAGEADAVVVAAGTAPYRVRRPRS